MYRIGYATDIHPLVVGRKLFLCGVNIPYDKDVNYSTQLFISQPDGNLYIRASNGNINN